MGFLDRVKNALNPDDAMRKQGRTTAPDGKEMVIDGPFMIGTEEGRLICKNCGVQFDSATAQTVNGFYLDNDFGQRTAPGKREHFAVPCRKCDTYSMFLLSDVSKWPLLRGSSRQPWAWTDVGKGIQLLRAGPLPVYDKEEQILCRYCAMPFDEEAFELSRGGVHKNNWRTTDYYVIKCSNCKEVCGFALSELRERPD